MCNITNICPNFVTNNKLKQNALERRLINMKSLELKNCQTEFNLIRLHSRNGVSLLAKTCKDNTLVEYLVEENSNNGKRVYGVGDDLHVAFMTFLSFIETEN